MLRRRSSSGSSMSLSPSSLRKRIKMIHQDFSEAMTLSTGDAPSTSTTTQQSNAASSMDLAGPSENRKSPPLLVNESITPRGNDGNMGDPYRGVHYGRLASQMGRWASSEESEEGTPSPPSFSRAVAQVVYTIGSAKPQSRRTAVAFQSLGDEVVSERPDPCTPINSNTASTQSPTTSTLEPSLHEQATAVAASLEIPAALMAGKIINTEFGLALLLVPNGKTKPTDYAKLASTTLASTADTTKCKHWSKAEDDLLYFALSKDGGPPYNWTEISRTYFPNLRRPNQCKNRWKKLNPSTSNEPYSSEEDKIIIDGANKGLSWMDISIQLNSRSSESVRHRFVNTIDPSLLKNVAWTPEEEHILRVEQQKLGNKWKQIAKMLPGRSENDVKNHWHNAKIKTTRIIKTLAAQQTRTATLAQLRSSSGTMVPDRSIHASQATTVSTHTVTQTKAV